MAKISNKIVAAGVTFRGLSAYHFEITFMKRLLLCFILFAATGVISQAQTVINDLNVEKRTATGFHGIEVGTGIHLTITQGTIEEVAVSAASVQFRDRVVTKVENGILKIYYESKTDAINKSKERKELKAYVSYKTLDRLEASTGSEVTIDGILTAASLRLSATTGARVNGKISSSELKVNQNTGSVISLSGQAERLEVEGDTGSKFDAEDLVTGICNVKVSTGARIWVTANKELSAKANTGGNVKYKGEPAIKDIKRSTGGTVSKI